MERKDKCLPLPLIGAECISPFTNPEIKKFVRIGNYIDIFTSSEPFSLNLPTIYGITERGYIVCLTQSLSSKNRSIRVIETLAESVVRKSLYSINIAEHEGQLHMCLAHDSTYITVIISLVKPPSLKFISNDNLVKVSIKSHNKLQPRSAFFSVNKKYVFASYDDSIDIFTLSRGTKGLVPSLERLDSLKVKESLSETSCTRTTIIPSSNDDDFLYYLYRVEEMKEVIEVIKLKLTKEEAGGFSYNMKRIKVNGKASVFQDIIRIDVESKIKYYEWLNNMEKLVILLENNTLQVVSTGRTLKELEGSDIKLASKEYQKELTQFYSYKFKPNRPLKLVRWLDHGVFLIAITEDLEAHIFDSYLTPLRFNYEANPKNSLPLFKLTFPKMKNPTAERIMSREISNAKEALVIKRSIQNKTSAPFIISGSLPYSLLVYKLGFTLPWKNVALNEYYMVSQYLENGKVELALKSLSCIYNSEIFIECFMHVCNYLMRRPKILCNHTIIRLLISMYKGAVGRPDLEYLKPLLSQYYHKLGQRLLTSNYYEEAYNIALASESAILMRNIEYYCKWRGMLVMAEAAKKEAMKYDPSITTMAQEMTKISEYTHKTLTAEDIQNIINDYNILMNVNSIHELDLDEFNSWEINLKEYEKALQLELDGDYEEAKIIYERNKLGADAKRAENLQQIAESINQDVVQFTALSEITKQDKK